MKQHLEAQKGCQTTTKRESPLQFTWDVKAELPSLKSSETHMIWRRAIWLNVKSGKSNNGPVMQSKISLTRESLTKLKLKAVRRGVWFRDLKQEERRLLELTMRVVDKVHSFLLAKIVSRIVGKLCETMESRIFKLIKTEGKNLAESLSNIAQAWGYRNAKSWAKDRGFMQFLVVNNLSSLAT